MQHYRPDIDGLRAVAIVPVVLFHAGADALPGGFVGVDVFFVISGFLITGLLQQEIDGGRFSLTRFYERRIRRLFPALYAMLVGTSAIAAWLLLPVDLVAFGKSVLATSVFASNVLFWQESGYFGRAADETPLLHTWSLAVEEQFYILFPLFLVFVAARRGRRYVVATALVSAAAFVLSVVLVTTDRDAAFYLAPARAWELGLGALLALDAVPSSRRRSVRTAVAALGSVAIALSVLAYSPATAFPGTAALLPCLGAAAIIWAGRGGHNVVGDVLSARPVVLVGLVSYSLYLWHWPALALGRYYAVRDLTAVETTIVVALASVAAVASWRYVERPFRGKSGWLERGQLFGAAIVTTCGLAAIGAGVMVSSGWPARLDADVRRLADGSTDRRPHDWGCGSESIAAVGRGEVCRVGAAGATAPTFLLWGDSHARVMFDALGPVAARHGVSGLAAVRTRCPPLLGVRRVDRDDAEDCAAFNAAVVEYLTRAPEVTDVVLVARWALTAEGVREEPGETVLIVDPASTEVSVAENRRVFARSMRRSVEALRELGKRVWVVASVPEVGWDVPSVLARSQRFDRPGPPAPSRAQFVARQTHADVTLGAMDALPGVHVLRPDAVLCAGDRCVVQKAGRPLYFDSHHLSLTGAALLEPMFETIFLHRRSSANGIGSLRAAAGA
jgi:peptidoglycan/LPS O-acetylase OafA/YrhL